MARSTPPRPVPLAKPVAEIPEGSLASLRRHARDCRACPLWEHATQTVFGAGPARAEVMLIGEQPGQHEDEEGLPFAGPAGRLLDRALTAAGLDRASLYLTNTVKHFKYEERGTAKLHKRASAAEQAACRMWLAAELARVRPRVVVALGAMAAQTVLGASFRVALEHGKWFRLDPRTEAMATWHPAAILRARERREAMFAELVADLRTLRTR